MPLMPRPSIPPSSRLSRARPRRRRPRVPLRRPLGASARVRPLPLFLKCLWASRAATRARQRRFPASGRKDGRSPRAAAV
eukprot:3667674-Lingulodinium_polyedra.AAC.1